jgi:hypothetical protein
MNFHYLRKITIFREYNHPNEFLKQEGNFSPTHLMWQQKELKSPQMIFLLLMVENINTEMKYPLQGSLHQDTPLQINLNLYFRLKSSKIH